MNPLLEIIEAFTSSWLWTVVFILTSAFMWLLNDALGKKFNRQQLSRLLLHRRYAVLYHELLRAALARIDRWLTPNIGPSDEARETEALRAWSWPLFDFSLRLALAYPALTLVVAWGLLGTDGKLGGLVVLPAAGGSVRVGVLVALAPVSWLLYRSVSAVLQGNLHSVLYFALAAAVTLAVALAVALAVGFAIAFALFYAFLFSIAFLFILVTAGVGAFAITVAVIVAVAVAGASAVAGAVSAAGAFAGTVALAVAVAGTTAFAFTVAHAFVAVLERSRFGLVAYAGLVAFLLAGLALAARYSLEIDERGATVIVFLGLLPLLNAVFDFLSIGLTRFLLRRGAVSIGFGALRWAFLDVASALGFFALLGLALLTMVHWLNGLGAASLLDLAALFTDLREDDTGAYWWLYVTIFSTLLPTLLHLVLASFSALLAIMPEDVALFIRRQLPRIEVDAMAKALAFWTLSTIGFLAIAAVAFGLYGLVTGVLAIFPHLGGGYLWLFERYAAWLGAPVVPVRPVWL